MKLPILSTIALLSLSVAAGTFDFSYPREGTQLTHSREFGIYCTGTASGEAIEDLSYLLYFVPVVFNSAGVPQPDQAREIYLDSVPFNGGPKHYPGSQLPKKGSYQIWAKKFHSSDRGAQIPDGQKTRTFVVID